METKILYFSDDRNSSEDEANLHHIPFQIHYNGQATVEKKFSHRLQRNPDSNELNMEFRCRPLKGTEVKVPEGYKGLVADTSSYLKPKAKLDCEEKKDEKFFIKKDFKSLTYWNWDKVTSSADAQVKALDWLQLASSLHSPEEEFL